MKRVEAAVAEAAGRGPARAHRNDGRNHQTTTGALNTAAAQDAAQDALVEFDEMVAEPAADDTVKVLKLRMELAKPMVVAGLLRSGLRMRTEFSAANCELRTLHRGSKSKVQIAIKEEKDTIGGPGCYIELIAVTGDEGIIEVLTKTDEGYDIFVACIREGFTGSLCVTVVRAERGPHHVKLLSPPDMTPAPRG